ncbi:hypothetical protein EIN_080960 [Entamoeba invadens IP1]|uniref:hypothetical protein n=1 Tax=Entamoeba invadens IP1 TaxID=370355 RepID=UPI0002C3EAD9|nr:hypothetical protein EIN_080960 [Entamoeba invadens IP1]ELP85124.1 hypothetical protein EIN_080960 [Entamoeba invadens IP1]|eukprot:XP_004184470.1 hypothetical protein EIN_080960 [Entamoeba invadens IP1]
MDDASVIVPNQKDVYVVQNSLANGKSIDTFLQKFNANFTFEKLMKNSKSCYCLLPVTKYYTCLTCSEGSVKYCKDCFDFEFHQKHRIQEVERTCMCQCGMFYKGEFRCCQRHNKIEDFILTKDRNKEAQDMLENTKLVAYTLRFINKSMFRVCNTDFEVFVKELGKLFGISKIWYFIGKVIFKEKKCPFEPLFNKHLTFTKTQVQVISYFIFLPLLYHPDSSPLLQLVSKCDVFKNVLYELYATIPFDTTIYTDFRSDKMTFFKILIDTLKVIINPSLHNIPHPSLKVALLRCTNVFYVIENELQWFSKETNLFNFLLNTLLIVFNMNVAFRKGQYSSCVNFFEHVIDSVDPKTLQLFLKQIQTIPKAAVNTFLPSLFKVQNIPVLLEYSYLIPVPLSLNIRSFDVIYSFTPILKNNVKDPFTCLPPPLEIPHKGIIIEISSIIAFHNLWKKTEKCDVFDVVKKLQTNRNEIVLFVWLLNYNPHIIKHYLEHITFLRKYETEHPTQLVMQKMLIAMFNDYAKTPFLCNPFLPLAPSISLPFSLFIRKNAHLQTDRLLNDFYTAPNFLGDQRLTQVMANSSHYHFVLNIVWLRIDKKVHIENDQFIEPLVAHMAEYAGLNPVFKKDVIYAMMLYEKVTPGTQLLLSNHKASFQH